VSGNEEMEIQSYKPASVESAEDLSYQVSDQEFENNIDEGGLHLG